MIRGAFLVLVFSGWAAGSLLAQGASTFRIDTAAGGTAAGDGGPATAALLMQAEGLAFDSKGRLYVADANDHRVRRINGDGTISTVAGTGIAGFSGDGGPATAAQLRNPYGLAIDGQDNLYIADLGNSRVRMVTSGGQIKTVAGGGMNQPGPANDGGSATSYILGAPRNLAVDPAGNVFFSDFANNLVFEILPAGSLITAAGSGQAGYSGDFGTAQLAMLNAPAGLVFLQDGSLLICDSGNKAIRRLTGDLIETYLPSKTLSPNATLSAPTALAFNPSGFLLVADAGAGAVLSIDVHSGAVQFLPFASDIAVDGASNIYFSQQGFVSAMDTLGHFTTLAGSSDTGFFGENVRATAARLNQPTGIVADSADNWYVADRQTNRIRRIDVVGNITTFAGTGVAGYSGDGSPATAGQLNQPSSVAFDGAGNLLLADTANHAIRSISPSGRISTIAGTGIAGKAADGAPAAASPLNAPEVVLWANGRIYIADSGNHSVRAIDAQGNISRIAGSDSAGNSGDGGAATAATLQSPRGLAVDAAGNLFIADEGAGCIRKVDKTGNISTVTNAANGPWLSPSGLSVLADGSLLVSDYGTHEIRQLRTDGSAAVIAGTGSAGFSGDTGLAASAQVDAPVGLFANPDGTILIADTGNNRIRRLSHKVPVLKNTLGVRVQNAASGSSGAIAPGEIVNVTGDVVASSTPVAAGANGSPLPLFLGDTQIMINGQPVPLVSAALGRITFQAPYGLTGTNSALMQVFYRGAAVATENLRVAASRPGLYLVPGTRFQALAVGSDGSFNSPSNPAQAGASLGLFLTGEGLVAGTDETGVPNAVAAAPILPVSVTVDGQAAALTSVGEVIGTEGLLRVNFTVPANASAGPHTVRVSVGSSTTQPQAEIWTKSK